MRRNRLLVLMMVAVLPIASLYLSDVEARQLPVQQLLPSSLSWQQGPANLPQPAGDGVVFILGGTLYHAGGWAGQIAQPINAVYANRLSFGQPGGWDAPTSMPGGGRFGAAAVTSGGRTYMLGGLNGSAFFDRVDSFDGTSWRAENNLSQARNFPAAVVMGGRIYVGGGIGMAGVLDGVSSAPIAVPDGALGIWRLESPLPVPLFTRLAQWGTCLYVVGGKDSGGQQRNEVYRATWGAEGAITGWLQVALLPQPLALHQAVTRQSVLYVLGGETTGGSYSDKVYAAAIGADCSLSSWSIEPMPNSQGRRRVAAAVEGLDFFLVGGQLADGRYTGETWYVPTPTPTSTPTVTRTPTPTPTATPTGFWAAWQEPGVSIPVPVSGSAAARFIYTNNLEGAIPMTVTLGGWANFGPRGAKWFTDTLTNTGGTYTVEMWADAGAGLGDTFALDVGLGRISLPKRRGYMADFVFLPLVLRR